MPTQQQDEHKQWHWTVDVPLPTFPTCYSALRRRLGNIVERATPPHQNCACAFVGSLVVRMDIFSTKSDAETHKKSSIAGRLAYNTTPTPTTPTQRNDAVAHCVRCLVAHSPFGLARNRFTIRIRFVTRTGCVRRFQFRARVADGFTRARECVYGPLSLYLSLTFWVCVCVVVFFSISGVLRWWGSSLGTGVRSGPSVCLVNCIVALSPLLLLLPSSNPVTSSTVTIV